MLQTLPLSNFKESDLICVLFQTTVAGRRYALKLKSVSPEGNALKKTTLQWLAGCKPVSINLEQLSSGPRELWGLPSEE